jgi:CBS domain-containing protein
MKIREIMSPDVQCAAPDDNLVEAAAIMRDLGVGAVPVCDDRGQVVGMLTDRDIVVRAIADGRDPRQVTAHEVMTPGTTCVFDDQEVDDAVQLMEQNQIRRLPVLSRENQRLAGIISLGDIAVDAGARLSGEALKEVSQPSLPLR